MNTREIGRIGEALAEKYLLLKKYQIIAKNWLRYACELDFVCCDCRGLLVFIEVKYVRSSYCLPEELFTKTKRRRLLRGIQIYLKENGLSCEYRLDLLCLDKTHLRHYQNLSL